MAERAHPDDPGFSKINKYRIKFIKGIIPILEAKINPYAKEFNWRYNWASTFCENKVVLDVPCGMGWGTSLIKNAKKVSGLDISQEAIKEAIKRYSNRKRDFTVGSMDNLPYLDDIFDIIICLEGIEHVPVKVGEKFVSEIWRILKSGGLMLLSTPQHISGKHSGNPYHVYEYSPKEILFLVENKFIVKEMISREVDDLIVYYFVFQKR